MRMTMGRRAYPSDVTDEQWALIDPLIPLPSTEGRPPIHSRRELRSAILYVLRSGCPWRLLPHEFPAWQTVYWYFRRWQREGVWDQILADLRMQMRTKQGRDPEPSAGSIDSQSIKTSAVRGPEKGFDNGKKSGVASDTRLWTQRASCWLSRVTSAEYSDLQGGKLLLTGLKDRFPRMQLVWGDSHYGGTMLDWVKELLGWTVEVVRQLKEPKRGVLVAEGEDIDWEKLFPKGFRPLPRRWVIERSFAWIIRWRRLCRDHEGLPQTSEAFIKLSASARMLYRLAPSFPL
jgi:putative transposase